MWTFHPELLAQPAPRYTSYPTAAEFAGDVGPSSMEAALDSVGDRQAISIYLHIPYCREICWYCGCTTGAANRTARLDAYLARLEEEITLVAGRLGGRGRVGRIAFGGGSPNAVSPAAFLRLVDRVRQSFACADDPVLSAEIDPRGFGPDWAAALGQARVSRVSLGVQTFDPAVQAAIGRVQPAADIACAVDLLRANNVASINFDLMYGLPGQDADVLNETLAQAIALAPERLAVFGYAHVPHLIPRQRRIDSAALPDARQRFNQAALAHEVLACAGYTPIGFDHFALPGDALAQAALAGRLRRNFQGFTEDPAEILIGLGASAISAFPGWLLQNEKNTGRYHLAVGAGQLATVRGLRRTAEDRLRGTAIEALLTTGAAELADVVVPATAEKLAPFVAAGLIEWYGGRLQMMPGALPYARVIAMALDAYRDVSATRFSSAV